MILLSSTPKAGTHLIVYVIGALVGSPGRAISKADCFDGKIAQLMSENPLCYGHIRSQFADQVPKNAQVLVLVRDPRDVLLSMHDHVMTTWDNHPARPLLEKLDYTDRLIAIANGIRIDDARAYDIPTFANHNSGFADWPGATIIRYEDIVGREGSRILAAALPQFEESEIDSARSQFIFKASRTMNVGGSRWRSVLPLRVRDQLDPAVITSLGYPLT